MKTKKQAIKKIFLSCFGLDGETYTVSVQRGRQDAGEGKVYTVKASNIAFDHLSNMLNRGKLKQHVALSIYPTFILTPKRSRKGRK